MHLVAQSNPFSFIKRYLADKPDLLTDYVNFGFMVVKAAIVPLGALLRHLLVVQNIDPNTEPGRKTKEDFQKALDAAFDRYHFVDLEIDWYNKIAEELRRKNVENCRHNRIVETESIPVVPPLLVEPTLEVSATTTSSPIDDLTIFLYGDEEPTELMARTPALKETKKLADQYVADVKNNFQSPSDTKTTKTKKPSKIKRTKTGNVKAVKSSKKRANKKLKSTQEIVQARDFKGRFKGNFKRTPRQ